MDPPVHVEGVGHRGEPLAQGLKAGAGFWCAGDPGEEAARLCIVELGGIGDVAALVGQVA